MRRILWWLRRDLRLKDNLVLAHAQREAASVIPVFILDPKLLESRKLAPARKQFLFESLAGLDADLREGGSYLVLRRGDPVRELLQLVRETAADAVYFHEDYTPYASRRDARVVSALNAAGIPYETFNDLYLADPLQVLKNDGTPYTVYSRYRARFEQTVLMPSRVHTHKRLHTPPNIASIPLARADKHADAANGLCGGGAAANQLARAFVRRKHGLADYAESRNDLAADVTSHLSPHLHFGTISVRELVRMARAADTRPRRHAQVWIDELVWREFFNQVLFHFPHAAHDSFRERYKGLRWETNAAHLKAWREGRTGYPLVDAGMRQLNATGWMHNRARMVTASFLTKDLLIDWRQGEQYFLQTLVDGDVASNNGGWQWVAGTGTDAQPYFRILHPVRQSRRFDPTGAYIRHWVPELASLPSQYIHEPWMLPPETARDLKFRLGSAYPKPIVDHAVQRERALALYRR